MHHGDNIDERLRLVREAQKAAGEPLGATGQFPQGRLGEMDEGELRLAVNSVEGKVVIDFGKPVSWVAFDGNQAIELGKLLEQHGRRLNRGG